MVSPPIKVLIADDNADARTMLTRLLSLQPGIEVVGHVESGEKACEAVACVEPDVALMDVRMIGMGGVEATKQIVARFPDVCVIAYGWRDREYAMLAAGAHRFVSKDAPMRDLINGVLAAC